MVDLSIEPAKSGRSSCKSCNAKIIQGDVRVGVERSIGDHSQVSWYHVACFSKTKNAASQDIVDIDGYTSLTKAEQNVAKKEFEKAAKTAKSTKKTAKKAANSDSEDSESESDSPKGKGKKKVAPAKKASKDSSSSSSSSVGSGPLGGYSASELKTYKEHVKDIEDKSGAALKEILKKNCMTQTGNKADLIARVADCKTLGTLPNCTKCGGGRLRFDQKAGTYYCKGYMDDADFVNCSATYAKNEVVRGDWVD